MSRIARYQRRTRHAIEFLYIERDGATLTVSRGVRGSPGTTEIRTYASEDMAVAEHSRLSSAILDERFWFVGYGPPPAEEMAPPPYVARPSPFPGVQPSPAAARALAGVEAIDWASHGPGREHGPDVLRALGSADASISRAAREHDHFVHQSSPSEDFARAAPFLVALAATPEVHGRGELLVTLGEVSLQPFENEELAGWPMARDYRRAVTLAGGDDRLVAAHDAIAAERPRLLALLDDPDPHVRLGAAFALATLREHAAELRAPLLALLARSEGVERAAAAIAVGCLADATACRSLRRYLDDPEPAVRAAVNEALDANGMPRSAHRADGDALRAVEAYIPVGLALRRE